MNWIERAWHGPVWSKVITGVILAVIAAWYAKSDAAVQQLGRLGTWLGAPSGASNGDIVFVITIAVSTAVGAAYGLLGAMRIVFRVQRHPEAQSGPELLPPRPRSVGAAADLNDCFARLKALEGRSSETERYRKSVVGQRMFFRGSVVSVTERDELGVILQLRHMESRGLVFARYSGALRAQALALRNGDAVTVLGTLRALDRARASLHCDSLAPSTVDAVARAGLQAKPTSRTSDASIATTKPKRELNKSITTKEAERGLGMQERAALKYLAEHDGAPVDVDDFPEAIELSGLRTNQVLNELVRRKLIIRSTDYPYQCWLTDQGRDFVIRQRWA